MVFLPLLLTLALLMVALSVPVLLVAAVLLWRRQGMRMGRVVVGFVCSALVIAAFLVSTLLRILG